MPCLVSEEKMRQIAADVEESVKRAWNETGLAVYGSEFAMVAPTKPTPSKHVIQCDHWIGDTVFHKSVTERQPGIVIGVTAREAGVTYEVSFPSDICICYPCELSATYTPEWEKSAEEE